MLNKFIKFIRFWAVTWILVCNFLFFPNSSISIPSNFFRVLNPMPQHSRTSFRFQFRSTEKKTVRCPGPPAASLPGASEVRERTEKKTRRWEQLEPEATRVRSVHSHHARHAHGPPLPPLPSPPVVQSPSPRTNDPTDHRDQGNLFAAPPATRRRRQRSCTTIPTPSTRAPTTTPSR
jgi:hypothetical protein